MIASINEGARAAQTGLLSLLLVALYFLLLMITTTDEALLRETTLPVPQVGIQFPMVLSYAVAPLVFLILHVFTLIRYDILAGSLRVFNSELASSIRIEADRERLRALLANIEFVRVLAARAGSTARSRVYRFVAWLTVVALPFVVLFAVALSFRRYQSGPILLLQRICLWVDLAAIVWFQARLWRVRHGVTTVRPWWRRSVHCGRYAAIAVPLAWIIHCVGVPNQIWKGLDDSRLQQVKRAMREYKGSAAVNLSLGPWEFFRIEQPDLLPDMLALFQPFDMMVCPNFHWGCGYLRSRGFQRLLAGPTEREVIERTRTAQGAPRPEDIAPIEGLFLRERSLRFAELSSSNLYGADLLGADLTGADLEFSELPGAVLFFANLRGANLRGAKLPGANLTIADLSGADLRGATLTKAVLRQAHLNGAEGGLRPPDWSDQSLSRVELVAADLSHADVVGADLSGANLVAINLSRARLQGADLQRTLLMGADLRGAQLQGADLRGANLTGADLRSAKLWQARFDGDTDVSLVDLRDADFTSVGDNVEKLLDLFKGFLDYDRFQAAKRRVSEALAVQPEPFVIPAVKKSLDPILVDRVSRPELTALGEARLTTSIADYDRLLAPALAALPLVRPFADVAVVYAKKALDGTWSEDRADRERRLYPLLAILILEEAENKKVNLPQKLLEELKSVAQIYQDRASEKYIQQLFQ